MKKPNADFRTGLAALYSPRRLSSTLCFRIIERRVVARSRQQHAMICYHDIMMSALPPWLNCYKTKPKPETETDTHADQTTTNTQKYTDDELRDDWDARIENAQHCALKCRLAAVMDEPATAKRDALWARIAVPRHYWFSAELERSVTEQARHRVPRRRARRPLAPQLPFLPRGILESAALAPYLERWRLDASAAAAAPRSARCAYPTLD
jgi:hypothetical protein